MIVFLWWWGAGLSALANIFFDIWFKNIVIVDKYQSEITEKLQQKWIEVCIWDWIYTYSPQDIIIYSDAVINSQDFQKIQKNKKFSYFQFLWEISKRFQTISIAGTHWKTSTTAMTLTVWKNLDFDKLWFGIVWWFVPDLNNLNYYINPKHKDKIKIIFKKILTKKWERPIKYFKQLYFIIEADEFNRHFLFLDSCISLITKVDHDHKDIYKTEESYIQAFNLFITKTRKISYTIDEEFYKKISTKFNNTIKLIKPLKPINFKYIFWSHMQKNANLVLQLYKYLWFQKDQFISFLENFNWIWRRQEYLWRLNNLKIYTDYAHHPVEINATYQAFRKNFQNKKLIWVFQPHQIFRFISYKNEFIKALKFFDEIYIYDIYSVRENNLLKELTWLDLPKEQQKQVIWQKIAKKVNWKYISNFKDLINNIKNKNWICVMMTAGDLDYKIRTILKK